MDSTGFRPLVFVAMPFGVRADPTGSLKIDFDSIYRKGIHPAARDANVDVIRGDEEMTGGVIHLSIYERLLLSEIVIADLTLSTPNVYYEVGVRHAARPRSTILLFAKEHIGGGSRLPFDLEPVRAIPYALNNGHLSDEAADQLRARVAEGIRVARMDDVRKDSPLFQLIKDYPGVPLAHEATDAFRDRGARAARVERDIEDALRQPQDAIAELARIENQLSSLEGVPSEAVIRLFLAYRDAEGWSEMIELAERAPEEISSSPTVREQVAFAYNRRNLAGDRARAIEILYQLIDHEGPTAENCGLVGRVYKDQYEEAKGEGDTLVAEEALESAIEWYERGFRIDPRDSYPGINALTLLLCKGTPAALRRIEELQQVVTFAVGRRGGLQAENYWDLATLLELAVVGSDTELGPRACARILFMPAVPAWQIDTTCRNLRLLCQAGADAGRDVEWVRPLIERLERAPKRG